MKRLIRCCSCSFEELVDLPEDTTIEQLVTFGNEWRLKHQPNCNTDPIKEGTFPTTEIIPFACELCNNPVVRPVKAMQTDGKERIAFLCDDCRGKFKVKPVEKLDPLCELIIPCNLCRAEILCQYKTDKREKGILPGIPEIKIPEDIDVSARLMSGMDKSRCTLHDKIVGVHDQSCENKKLPFRSDDIRVPVIWRILGTTEQVCGTCYYFEALEKCVKDAVANGDLPIDSVYLEED